MSWKLDENGSIVMKDGNPVYVDSQGQEKTVSTDTITRLNKEAKDHRIAKEEALEKLKAFEGIDPDKARTALETVSKLDAKELIAAGKVDEVKAEITKSFSEKLAEKDKVIGELTDRYNNMVIDNIFANSEFIRNEVAVPTDMFKALYRHNFKVENGQPVVYDNKGDRMWSKEHEGEYATPEEGLRILAMAHPNHDSILRANPGNGSGAGNGGGGNGGYVRSIRRSEFEQLSPVKQAEVLEKIKKQELRLTD